jgi:hypothetical protein
MDLAMVKQEQGETLRKYMQRFFNKRATIVDVTDKEVIDLFQDGLYHRRTFEDFSRRRLSSITHLKDMITSWADEEDKANAKYDAIRGKSKQNTGGNSNNNGNQGGRSNNYSGPNRKRKLDNIVTAIQRPAKDNSKKTSGDFKDLLKEKCPWHLEGNHTTEQCYQLRRALKDTAEPRHPHNKKGKKMADKGNDDFQEPDKTVNVLFEGLPNRRAQKATRREVLSIEPAVLTPLRWPEVPITFSRADQWTSFSKLGCFPLALKLVVAGSRLNKVLIDGGSGLNVLFTKTLKKMKLDITHMLTKSTRLSTTLSLGPRLSHWVQWSCQLPSGRQGKTTAPSTSSLKSRTSRLPIMPSLADQLSPSSWRYLTIHTWYSRCQVRPVYSRYKGT